MAQGALAPAAPVPALTPAELHEILQCEKLVRFRDDIFAGKHPRIKIPANLVGKLNNSARTSSTPNATSSRSNHTAAPPVTAANDATVAAPAGRSYTQEEGKKPDGAKPVAAPEIHPVLLEKSEDLIRAEIQLARQRLERALRDQVEQRKIATKAALQAAESLPEFDVPEVLASALVLVKSTEDAVDDGTGDGQMSTSDSFDDNTFYSSQHDTPEQSTASHKDFGKIDHDFGAEVDQPVPLSHSNDGETIQDVEMAEVVPDDNVGKTPTDSATTRALAQRDVGVHDAQTTLNSSHQRPESTSQRANVMDIQASARLAPAVPPGEEPRTAPFVTDDIGQRATGQRQENMPQRDASPLYQTSHLLSPVAPQPARVSPLAQRSTQLLGAEVLDEPYLGQVSSLRKSGPESTSGSPKHEKALRKKKKEKRKSTNKHAPASPGSPYIKPEPRSPSPLEVVRLRPNKRQKQNLRAYPTEATSDVLEYDEPREPQPAAIVYEDERVGSYGRRHPNHHHAVERVGDQPGHRIVSEQYREPRLSPHGYEIHPQAYPRAALDPEPVRYVERGRVIEVDVSRPRSPLGRERQSPTFLRPPPRVASGEYGYQDRDEVYAPAQPTFQPMSRYRQEEFVKPVEDDARITAAPAYVRPREEVVYHRAPVRAFSTRPPEVFEEGDFVYRRAPSVVPRRVVTQPDQERAYGLRETSVRPRPMMPPPAADEFSAPERRQFEEPPREYVRRYASAHPEAPRYEAPREFRMSSVRPDRLESQYPGNVRQEPRRDGPTVLREYSARPEPVVRDYSVRPEPVVQYGPRSTVPVREYSGQPMEAEGFSYHPGMRRGPPAEYFERPREVPQDGPAYADNYRHEYR